MATSNAFNFYTANNEQTLVENLILEAISIYGHNVYYLPREQNANAATAVFNEDPAVEYNSNYPIEMYVRSVDGFAGDQQFLSKFNIEIRDQITLTVSEKRFKELVRHPNTAPVDSRPREGALIYFPLDKKLFEVKNVNRYSTFFQLGYLYTFDLTCETFEYSSEKLNTGIPAVDAIEVDMSVSTSQSPLVNANGAIVYDANGQPSFSNAFSLTTQSTDFDSSNEHLANAANTLIDFSVDNPFSEKF